MSGALALLALALIPPGHAASAPARPAPATSAATEADRDAASLADFEKEAASAKERGIARLAVTTGLPPALWQFDPPDDPYPAWYVGQQSFLKIFTPKELQPYVDQVWAKRTAHLVEERCRILRKYGLKGQWNSDEPQQLPEAFFQAYPKLRGPRVDQPNRSRVARFAPCVDQPETLQMYRDALKALWAKCPEIDSFSFLTSDSGSGFCWVPGLYPGINGHSDCKDRPMEERVAGFMKNFQTAADEAGIGLKVSVNINPIGPRQWMTPSFSEEVIQATVKLLPAGMSISGREGPDGRRSAGGRGGAGGGGNGPFYPVVGLPAMPAGGGRTGGRGGGAGGGRGGGAPNEVERVTAQRATAVEQVGEDSADDLMAIWNSVLDAQTRLSALDFGAMLRFGHVLTRWINRPMVPFPDELKPEEKDYYRKYLFQARSEQQAEDLADVQGMLMYKGWGAKMLFQRVIETTVPDLRSAQAAALRIAGRAKDEKQRHEWQLHAVRFDAAVCLLNSADNMVAFQAHLDRVHELGLKPEYNPPLGVKSDWARTDMMETARKEIDNTVHLMELIRGSDEPVIDMAPTQAEEYVMRLGPDLLAQLQRKIDTMNAHWRDYDRIFTVPNP
ncbi:MAG TPA: hypothetical protein VG838_00845 [Opitutaceae bacterium]|nr:hypothetical protein [Opitutaceae bacterium]